MNVIFIGRYDSNDIVLDDPAVSRIHCQFIQDEKGNIYVLDLKSTNGVYVNGIIISGKKCLLQSDVVVPIPATDCRWGRLNIRS